MQLKEETENPIYFRNESESELEENSEDEFANAKAIQFDIN